MRNQNELCHYGIMGMKWGVRRYQNSDGSYTPAGRARYGKSSGKRQSSRSNVTPDESNRSKKIKKVVIIGAAVTAAALAAYGGYRVSKEVKLNKKIQKTVDQAIRKSAREYAAEMAKTYKDTFGENAPSSFTNDWYKEKANPGKSRILLEQKALKSEYKNARKVYKELGREFGIKHPDWKFFDEHIAPTTKYRYTL